jgi:curli biogenesis system outer membrane secretion channel CsgG
MPSPRRGGGGGHFKTAVDDYPRYLVEKIPAKSKVLVLNFSAAQSELSAYILDAISARLVNDSDFTVVDRRDLGVIRQELKFQMSGEVSDNTAVSIGKKLGAQSIISGSIEPLGERYRFTIRAIEVETATIQAIKNYIVSADTVLLALTGKNRRIGGANGDFKTLNESLKDASDYLTRRLKAKSKVAVFNISADSAALSTYCIDELQANLVNGGIFSVVDRRNLDALQAELQFQRSGEVSDGDAVSAGKKLGAQSIILGSIEPFGELYRLHIRAIEVETAWVEAMQNYMVARDDILAGLAGTGDRVFQDALWKNKRLYIGLRPALSIRMYDTEGTAYSDESADNNLSMDIALQIDIQLHRLFALQTEFLFTADTMHIDKTINAGGLYSYDTVQSFSSNSLIIPLFAKLTYRPSSFDIDIFGGVYMDIPLDEVHYKDSYSGTEESSRRNIQFGFGAGGSFGIKLGPGILYLDARYMRDFMNTSIMLDDKITDIYKRSIIAFGIGYRMGFFNGQ